MVEFAAYMRLLPFYISPSECRDQDLNFAFNLLHIVTAVKGWSYLCGFVFVRASGFKEITY